MKISWVFIVLALGSDALPLDKGPPGSSSNIICEAPYQEVGDRCVFVDIFNSGTWEEMRYLCEVTNGRMLKLDDAELMYDVVNFIHDKGLEGVSFWIGGTDEGHEGEWKWIDGTPIRMGTPFWDFNDAAITQEPAGGTSQNCLYLTHTHNYYFRDYGCENSKNVICENALQISGQNLK